MFNFKPTPGNYDHASMGDAVGWLLTDFECFAPNPAYNWDKRGAVDKNKWPIIVPKNAPPIGELPDILKKLVKRCWKTAEPSFYRGDITIGTRGGPAPQLDDHFHSYVRPTKTNIPSTMGNEDAIASDWKIFEQIKRTHSVSFRGDKRTPYQVIVQAKGFFPPISRTDQYYLHNNVYKAFEDYLNRRYQRPITQDDFIRAVDATTIMESDKKLLVDYMMWRKITEKEAVHLGRMVENECLKGYISTARAIDTSIQFATMYGMPTGWLYLTIVHGGFEVPWGHQSKWGSEEAEIAQWGPIPAERIVGFTHVIKYQPDWPIFIRRSFRKAEPEAFEYMFNVMSGARPDTA